jgi:hypothetical protein
MGAGTLIAVNDERKDTTVDMSQGETNECRCGGPGEILADLVEEDLLELQPGERLWKLYCFRDTSHPTGLRHRIYTKEKASGRLALLTFAVHNPPREGEDGARPAPVRSALARVPDLSPDDLDRLILAMRAQAGSNACEEMDLSGSGPLEAQLARLQSRAES